MEKRIGIIGGGIVGTAVAYFLSQYPEAEVTLFEKNSIGSGTTAKSAATFCLIDDSVSHEFWSVRLFGFNLDPSAMVAAREAASRAHRFNYSQG